MSSISASWLRIWDSSDFAAVRSCERRNSSVRFSLSTIWGRRSAAPAG